MVQSRIVQRVAAYFNSVSLRNQLLISLLGASIVPLILMSTVFYHFSKNIIIKESTARLQAIADQQTGQIRSYFEERERFVTGMSLLPFFESQLKNFEEMYAKQGIDSADYNSMYQSFHEFLSAYLEGVGLTDLFLIAPNGDVLFSMKKGEDYGTNLRTGVFRNTDLAKVFDNAAMLLEVQNSNFDYYAASNEPAAFLGAPVISDDNILLGVIVLQLSNKDIFQVVNKYEGLGETGETVILAEANGIATHMTPTRHDPLAAFRRSFSMNEPGNDFEKDIVKGGQKTEITTDYRGKEVLSFGKFFLPSLGWSGIVKMDTAELFDSIKFLRTLIFGSLIVLIVLILSGVSFLSKTIHRPIQMLTEYARMLAAGNLSLHIPVRSKNEIGVLSDEFNMMARQLDKIIKTLEGKFETRTIQLQETNEELIKAVDDLMITQNRMVEQEKLASLGALTAGIAHEIKNPLNFINNFSVLSLDLLPFFESLNEKIKSSLTNEESVELLENIRIMKENLHTINEQGVRTNNIVKRMLAHARQEKQIPESVNINQVLDESINLAFQGFRAKEPSFNVAIRKDLDSKLPLVTAIGDDIGRVFLNLLNNAFYSLNQKSLLGIADYTATIWVKTNVSDTNIEIKIRDNGLGISEELQTRIFAPFFTTKPNNQGTGLGLSLSYAVIVDTHKGKMFFESKPGEYVEFTILLPIENLIS